MNVLISDKLAQEGIDILKEVKGLKVDCKFNLTPDGLKSIIKSYDALIVRSATKVTADIIDKANKLKFIGRAGVGVDNVDLKAATRKGIVVMNTPGGNTTSTAEHTMSMILAMSRNIPQAYASLKSGKWERSKFNGVELYGKTLGILGLGRIGSTVARMAKAFGMKILAYDPFLSMEVVSQLGVELVDMKELLKKSDYITLHLPKGTKTTRLISDKEFGLMKKNVRLVNCARGGIIDEAALVKALRDKRIAACAMDVFEQEPLPADSPFLKFNNCIVTPHLGASTSEAQVNVAIEIAETLRDALTGKGIRNAANFPSVSEEAYQVLEPYIDLAERMGRFSGQLVDGRIQEIKITYSGVVTKYKVAPVTLALVHGVLGPVLGETINSVNAIDIARERAIKVQEVQASQEEEFVNRISARIKTDKETFALWGTLSGNNQPRIVKLNKVYVEAIPQGYMLFIRNNDKPGIVGAVGTLLAKKKINIASITFGRESRGGLAISVVNVDSKVPEDVIKELRRTKNVLFAKLIKV